MCFIAEASLVVPAASNSTPLSTSAAPVLAGHSVSSDDMSERLRQTSRELVPQNLPQSAGSLQVPLHHPGSILQGIHADFSPGPSGLQEQGVHARELADLGYQRDLRPPPAAQLPRLPLVPHPMPQLAGSGNVPAPLLLSPHHNPGVQSDPYSHHAAMLQ